MMMERGYARTLELSLEAIIPGDVVTTDDFVVHRRAHISMGNSSSLIRRTRL